MLLIFLRSSMSFPSAVSLLDTSSILLSVWTSKWKTDCVTLVSSTFHGYSWQTPGLNSPRSPEAWERDCWRPKLPVKWIIFTTNLTFGSSAQILAEKDQKNCQSVWWSQVTDCYIVSCWGPFSGQVFCSSFGKWEFLGGSSLFDTALLILHCQPVKPMCNNSPQTTLMAGGDLQHQFMLV